jgi:cobyrinic acid a,c-diamide synthase
MKLPRLLIGGTSSGSGKTSLFLGLLEAMKGRGADVRPFKAGPDFLDPALHGAVLGKSSHNLDARLMGSKGVLACLERAGAGGELALVEGVMGYYDGEPNSSADLARLIGAPAVLLLDVHASAESAAATAFGFARYRRGSRVAGFVANRIASERHYEIVRKAVEKRTGLPMLGYLPADERLALSSRHLGLIGPEENADFEKALTALGGAVSAHIDLDLLLELAESAGELPEIARRAPRPLSTEGSAGSGDFKIAVARDAAFSFYYEDNFDALRDLGAELAFFSPLHDSDLPEGSSALYLGGGYPELHLGEIEGNENMRSSIRKARDEGMPIYAECGGYLYLLEAMKDAEGKERPCVGVAPGISQRGSRLASLGYREGRTLKSSLFGKAGTLLRGHVFHYFEVEGAGEDHAALKLARPGDSAAIAEGYAEGEVFASFLHIHFAGNPSAAEAFAKAARRYERQRRGRHAR